VPLPARSSPLGRSKLLARLFSYRALRAPVNPSGIKPPVADMTRWATEQGSWPSTRSERSGRCRPSRCRSLSEPSAAPPEGLIGVLCPGWSDVNRRRLCHRIVLRGAAAVHSALWLRFTLCQQTFENAATLAAGALPASGCLSACPAAYLPGELVHAVMVHNITCFFFERLHFLSFVTYISSTGGADRDTRHLT